MKKRVLFITNHRKERSPGQRFRFEQFIEFLENNGFQCEFSYIISEADDAFFYKKGHYVKKAFSLFRSIIRRYKDLRRSKDFDLVFIFREALVIGSTFFERRMAKKVNTIFDFDDSIWIPNVSDANKHFNWIKSYSKTARNIKTSNLIFAGNQYLADYAKKHNSNVVIIPTTIDTEEYKPIPKISTAQICIGWSGSITTIQHFEFAIPFLEKLKEKYGEKIIINVIGDKNYFNESLRINGIGWNKSTEIEDLCKFDIGIMPLPDDEWANGKCGLKGLQYMALEIPTIMSPVGVNKEIIEDGYNGFLATSIEEWVEKISLLIESPELRKKIGIQGRQTVIEKFSFDALKDAYLKYFTEQAENRK